jgi:hypothetical protein
MLSGVACFIDSQNSGEHGRGDDQFARQRRMPDGDLQGDVAAVAVAEEVGLFDLEMPKKSGGVVRRTLEAVRPIDVVGVPVSLLLERDHLPGLCEGLQHLSERSVDGRSAAVKKDQRQWFALLGAVNLVIHLESVHRSVADFDVRCALHRRNRSRGQNHQQQHRRHGGEWFPAIRHHEAFRFSTCARTVELSAAFRTS